MLPYNSFSYYLPLFIGFLCWCYSLDCFRYRILFNVLFELITPEIIVLVCFLFWLQFLDHRSWLFLSQILIDSKGSIVHWLKGKWAELTTVRTSGDCLFWSWMVLLLFSMQRFTTSCLWFYFKVMHYILSIEDI